MTISAVKSWRTVAAYIIAAVMAVLFVYGVGRFPNGPISECGSGYCSTRHVPYTYTEADYRAYRAWEKTIFIVWPLGMIVGFLLQRDKQKGTK